MIWPRSGGRGLAGPPTGRGGRAPDPACGRSRGATAALGAGAPDRGSTTAELAAGLPALLLLLLAGLVAVGAATTQLRCVDAARSAALAASRGEPGVAAGEADAPAGAQVSVSVDGDTVVAVVRAPVPLLGLRMPGREAQARAVAALEPGVSAGEVG